MATPRVGMFIQARSTSTRLPGKIFEGLPGPDDPAILEHIYRRLGDVRGADLLLFLVPDSDRALIETCEQHGFPYAVGSELDVRERYRQAARAYRVDIVVRATGDNPCVDPGIADETIAQILKTDVDLLSYANLPLGIAVEAFRTEALLDDRIAAKPEHREHVSIHIKQNRDLFKVLHLKHPLMNQYAGLRPPRLTVDTLEDLEVVRGVFRLLGDSFTTKEVMDLFAAGEEFFSANKHVEQLMFLS